MRSTRVGLAALEKKKVSENTINFEQQLDTYVRSECACKYPGVTRGARLRFPTNFFPKYAGHSDRIDIKNKTRRFFSD